jgi:membrane protein YdbS with pleckstrin-like domain
MTAHAERAAEWVYRGLWGVLSSWFNVPREPPTLPAAADESLRTFKPSPRFLAYQKFYFWIVLTLIDGVLTIAWLAILFAAPLVGVLLFPVYLAIAVIPDILAYIAIHLRYDSTWYVLSDRSMRLRRGIWVIHETTITYENIQNIGVRQGPVQRHFGIATLTVHTAGGGAGSSGGGKHGHAGMTGAHLGVIEGITDARELRDRLMARVERSRSAGVGDERHDPHVALPPRTGLELRPEHLAVLAEIRELVKTRPA